MNENHLLSLKEAASIVGISPQLLSYYIKTDRGPKVTTVAGHPCIDPSELEGWHPEQRPIGRPKNSRKGLTAGKTAPNHKTERISMTEDNTTDAPTPSPAPVAESAPAGIPPVFIVASYPAANIFGTLADASAELQKQAAANPGTEFAIFESRRTGEAPAPTVTTQDVAVV